MRSRRSFAARLNELRERVAEGAGELGRDIRMAAASGAPVPAEAQSYADKVRLHAYKVADRDVEKLMNAGWSEDEIFELTVATAMHAGLSRWNHARQILEEAQD